MTEHTNDTMDYTPLSIFTPSEVKDYIAYNKDKLDKISKGRKILEASLAELAEQPFITKEDVADGREDALTLHLLLKRKKEIEAAQGTLEHLDAINDSMAEGKKGGWKAEFGAWVRKEKERGESVAGAEGVLKKELEV